MIAELLLGTVLASAAGGVHYLVVVQRREKEARERERQSLRARFRESLVQRLRSRGASRDFRFSEYVAQCDIPRHDADRVADDLYLQLCRKEVASGVIAESARKKLMAMARFLELDECRAGRLEDEAKREAYRAAVSGALADGVVTGAEAIELESLRVTLGIDAELASASAGDLSRDAYLSLLRRVADSGQVTAQVRSDLDRLKRGLALGDDDARRAVQGEALALYRRLFTFVVQDGVVTPEEESALDWLQREAGLFDSDVRVFKQKIADMRRYVEYREGRLPVLNTRLILHSGELCHWQGECDFRYHTPSGQERWASGTLLITSKNLMFKSPSKTFSVSPSKILDIRRASRGVALDSSVRNGSGFYGVGDPEGLEAVLTGLVRKHKYLAVEGYSSTRSRHIPNEVKAEVWARDGGRCVHCDAQEYLEFDHIIPHAKGGANTVGNIQLLCRRCNLGKKDRI
jgi:hypothetical protein